jgi:tRNA(adenine34) deaminase
MKFDDEYFMKQAINEAKIAYEKDEVPIGAVVVCGNQIIGRGHNLTQTLNDVTAHAEMIAITSASDFIGSKYLKTCTLYVTVEPCVMCAGAIHWAQISKIVYGTPDTKKGFSKYSENILLEKTKIEKGICENTCSELVVDFFKQKRL